MPPDCNKAAISDSLNPVARDIPGNCHFFSNPRSTQLSSDRGHRPNRLAASVRESTRSGGGGIAVSTGARIFLRSSIVTVESIFNNASVAALMCGCVLASVLGP